MSDDANSKVELSDYKKQKVELDEKYKGKSLIEVFNMSLDEYSERSDEEAVNNCKKHAKLKPQEKFQSWVKYDSWNLVVEAIPLTLGYSPDFYPAYERCDKSIKFKVDKIIKLAKSCVFDSLPVSNQDDPIEKWRVDSHDFLKWVAEKEIEIDQGFLDIYNQVNSGYDFDSASHINERPEYITPLLSIVYKVIDEFYEGQSIDHVLSREDMIPYLKEKYTLSGNEAKAIDTITRHPSKRFPGSGK